MFNYGRYYQEDLMVFLYCCGGSGLVCWKELNWCWILAFFFLAKDKRSFVHRAKPRVIQADPKTKFRVIQTDPA